MTDHTLSYDVSPIAEHEFEVPVKLTAYPYIEYCAACGHGQHVHNAVMRMRVGSFPPYALDHWVVFTSCNYIFNTIPSDSASCACQRFVLGQRWDNRP